MGHRTGLTVLKLSDMTSKFRDIAVFVICNLRIIFHNSLYDTLLRLAPVFYWLFQ